MAAAETEEAEAGTEADEAETRASAEARADAEEATPENVVKFSRGIKRGAPGLESKKKKFRWENF